MSILDIRVLGDPVLRKPTRPVTEITDELRRLIADMFETMYAAEGIGLAAPQIGRTERLAVVDVDGAKFTLINPIILSQDGANEKAEEGCLSIPDIYGDVERPGTAPIRDVQVGERKGRLPRIHKEGAHRDEGRAPSRDGDVVRVVFWGTPEFAAPTLRALLGQGFDVVGVVTQPDKPQGRSRQIIPSPVKQIALEEELEIFQPKNAKG